MGLSGSRASSRPSCGAREAAPLCPSVSRFPPAPDFRGSRVRTGPGSATPGPSTAPALAGGRLVGLQAQVALML